MQVDELSKLVSKYRLQIIFLILGLILIGGGLLFARNVFDKPKIEIIEENGQGKRDKNIIVEVAGSVKNPGVYKLEFGSRVEDAINIAGGISQDADTFWLETTLNRAAKLIDGQKIYIPKIGIGQNRSSVLGTDLININTASQQQLESLPGIGPVTAQNIIEQRPYSTVDDLLNKHILSSSVYQKNKDKLSVI